MFEFYMYYPHKMEMVETLKIKFSCDFNFVRFPFDRHECDFAFYEKLYYNNYVFFEKPAAVYFLSEEYEESEFLKTPKHPFKIKIKINDSKNWNRYKKNTETSVSSIKLILQRDSFGLLLGGFYIPTSIFAISSIASFTINPDSVCIFYAVLLMRVQIRAPMSVHSA